MTERVDNRPLSDTIANELTRGIWVWNTTIILSSASQICDLVAGTQHIGISDIYLYMAPSFYSQHSTLR